LCATQPLVWKHAKSLTSTLFPTSDLSVNGIVFLNTKYKRYHCLVLISSQCLQTSMFKIHTKQTLKEGIKDDCIISQCPLSKTLALKASLRTSKVAQSVDSEPSRGSYQTHHRTEKSPRQWTNTTTNGPDC